MPRFTVSEKKEQALIKRMFSLGIHEADLEENFIRGTGSGGQKINKTSSCVQLKYKKSGEEIKCQKTRSQSLNRYYARLLLCEKIEEKKLGKKSKRQQEIEKIKRQKRKRSKKAKEKVLRYKKENSEKKNRRTKVSYKDDN